jgi:two-component system response regulator MprA
MTHPNAKHANIASPLPSPSATVVVVDDDPHLVAALEDLLRDEGYAVEGFTDPAAALEHLCRGAAPDLILIDCVMPRLSGGELVEALAAAGVNAPVVMMTALSDPGFCVDLDRLDVLNKPFYAEDLLAEIAGRLHPCSGTRSVRVRA